MFTRISRITRTSRITSLILVNNLQKVIVNIALVDELQVLEGSVIAIHHLNEVFLDLRRLLHNAVLIVGELLLEEPFPFAVGELNAIELFELSAQIRNQILLGLDSEILIALTFENRDKPLLQRRLALIQKRILLLRFIAPYDRVLVRLGNQSKIVHYPALLNDSNLSR